MTVERDPLHDFQLLIRSRYGALLVETSEEDRAQALVERAAWQLQLPLFIWRRATGLRRTGTASGVYGSQDPRVALSHVIESAMPALYVFHGLGPELGKPEVADLVREAAHQLSGRAGAIVLTGGDVDAARVAPHRGGPRAAGRADAAEYEELLGRVVRDLSARMQVGVTLSSSDQDRLLANLQGLALAEAEKLLTRVIVEDGRLDAEDIRRVVDAKRELVERDGLLEYCPAAGDAGRHRRPGPPQGVAREAAAVHGRSAPRRRVRSGVPARRAARGRARAAARASAPRPWPRRGPCRS